LPPEKLTIAMQRLKDLPVHDTIKDSIGAVLRAAANPHAESIDVIIKTLDKPRRKMIDKTAKGLRELQAERMARGKARLEAMSDEEWQKLVDDSTDG
jgi:hypothetical protein